VTPYVYRELGPCLADTDQDGIFDIYEDLNANGNLADDDTDGDSVANFEDVDDDGDGIATWQTTEGGSGTIDNATTGTAYVLDSDSDGTPNYIDASNLVYNDGPMVLSSYQSLIGDKRYELSNHLGNVLVVVNDKKIPAIDPNSLNLNYFNADVLSYNDYYPFGSLVPQRHASVDSYRYGFGGHENDNEIKGEGNYLDFGNFGYDSRTGRRWNVDPVIKSFESPYATFRNNPNYYVDPTGLNGEVTVDKKEKKITVKNRIYYNKNDQNLKNFAITADQYNSRDKEMVKALISDFKIDGVSIIDDNGICWDVEFKTDFIAKETEAEVEEALKLDLAGDRLTYIPEHDVRTEASYSYGKRSFNIYGVTSKQTATHEIFHALGLPHSVFIPDNEFFGNCHDFEGIGLGKRGGIIMSYTADAHVSPSEVKFMLQNAISIANKATESSVDVIVTGFVYKNVSRKQMEEQFVNSEDIKAIDTYIKMQNNPKHNDRKVK
jgi:hypothetical protein